MKIRILAALSLSLFLLVSCGSPATSEPVAAPTIEEAPAQPTQITQPTEPPKPTAMPFDTEPVPFPTNPPSAFALTSIFIVQEQPIPVNHSCDGEDISPPLDWNEPPGNTQSFALIMDDPDAPGGTWVHWVLFNIPGDARSLLGNLPPDAQLPDGSIQGVNSFGRNDYGGPCPPSGTHRYFFKLYALDITLSLDESAGKDEVLAAMEGHILAQAELMGTYSH